MEEIFTNIYRKAKWGGMSGVGSSIAFNKEYFKFISTLLIDNKIKSVVDLGCGDFVISKEIFFNTAIEYTGIDCVEFIINILKKLYSQNRNIHFLYYDIFSKKEYIPPADLFLLKDILQHWMNSYIYEFLDYIVSKYKNSVFMIINSCNQVEDNQDIKENGQWRPLSARFLPLKKYNPEILFHYQDKEISIIKFDDT
jgi:hypothetical protein